MLNEFTYCPRLFFLEWVDGQFVDNYYTVDGQFQHRAVNKETESSGLLLSSNRLGIIARIDLLDADDDMAIPVETKRGTVPSNPDQSWEPDRIQLCAQGLLLREHDFRCSHGQIFYAESQQRVTVPFTDELIAKTLKQVKELRSTAQHEQPPPPLVDSNKCPNCSLVGICLPDELNELTDRSNLPPRYLLPRHSSAQPLYVTEQGTTLGIRADRVQIALKNQPVRSMRLLDISQLNVYGGVQISSQLLKKLFSLEIPVCWFSYGGWFQGIAHGLPSKNVDLRRRQVAMSYGVELDAAKEMIVGKIKNCRTMLRRSAGGTTSKHLASLQELMQQVRTATSVPSLLGYEGAAARTYFQAFGSLLKSTDLAFDFNGRNRRPPLDPVNCLLSYLYALLTKELTAVTLGVGFDPYIGVYHRPRFGRPALALDLAEEFRPIIADSVAITMINNGNARPSHFIERSTGVTLTPKGRQSVLAAFERRMNTEIQHPLFGYQVTYRRTLEVQARLLAAYVLGETLEYKAFEVR